MRLIVVRHGQAVPKRDWTGIDHERPLVARGHRQAERLAKLIGANRPVRVISSPALRCVQTIHPYADKHGVTIELSEQLATDAHHTALDLCRQLMSPDPAHTNIVLCTHGEVLVELLPQLSKQSTRKLAHRPPGAKGAAWILQYRQHKLTRIDYHPPGA
jgi:8-oxo-(d)GTP phosphatase